jgi:hypothetical protein
MDMNTKEIQDIIIEYLPVRDEEKDKYGEVFTPQELINEMLDKLPSNVWSDPNLKWLDPANGIGNFPMLVFERLNEGLKLVPGYEDEKTRKEHIIKNMLYMVELNIKNVDVSKKIFGKSANIYHGSFLEDGWKDAFGIEKFDVIMGNPPFQKEVKEKTATSAGRQTIWDKFVEKSLLLLKYKGFLTFLHPPCWRGLGRHNKLWDLMKNKQILYLKIYGKKDGNKYFNVGSRFDVYVLQNKENTNSTVVIDELGNRHNLKLDDMPFLPNYAYKRISRVVTNKDIEGVNVIYDTIYHTQKKKTRKNIIKERLSVGGKRKTLKRAKN